MADRLPPDCGLSIEDLAAFGAIGLLEAFDRFKPELGIQFSTYVEYRIRGAMMDALRQNDAFTRYRRQAARRLDAANAALRQELQRAPTPDELAARLEIDLAALWSLQEKVQSLSFVSIFDTGGGDEDRRSLAEVLVGSDGQDPVRALLGDDARALLKAAIRELPERRRQCVVMYYGRGLNLAEIAQVLDVTPSRVSQILTAARAELREMLQDQVELADLEEPAP